MRACPSKAVSFSFLPFPCFFARWPHATPATSASSSASKPYLDGTNSWRSCQPMEPTNRFTRSELAHVLALAPFCIRQPSIPSASRSPVHFRSGAMWHLATNGGVWGSSYGGPPSHPAPQLYGIALYTSPASTSSLGNMHMQCGSCQLAPNTPSIPIGWYLLFVRGLIPNEPTDKSPAHQVLWPKYALSRPATAALAAGEDIIPSLAWCGFELAKSVLSRCLNPVRNEIRNYPLAAYTRSAMTARYLPAFRPPTRPRSCPM